jgi:hypothetical protein
MAPLFAFGAGGVRRGRLPNWDRARPAGQQVPVLDPPDRGVRIGGLLVFQAVQSPRPVFPLLAGLLVILLAATADGPAGCFHLVPRPFHRILDLVVAIVLIVGAFVFGDEMGGAGQILLVRGPRPRLPHAAFRLPPKAARGPVPPRRPSRAGPGRARRSAGGAAQEGRARARGDDAVQLFGVVQRRTRFVPGERRALRAVKVGDGAARRTLRAWNGPLPTPPSCSPTGTSGHGGTPHRGA